MGVVVLYRQWEYYHLCVIRWYTATSKCSFYHDCVSCANWIFQWQEVRVSEEERRIPVWVPLRPWSVTETCFPSPLKGLLTYLWLLSPKNTKMKSPSIGPKTKLQSKSWVWPRLFSILEQYYFQKLWYCEQGNWSADRNRTVRYRSFFVQNSWLKRRQVAHGGWTLQ